MAYRMPAKFWPLMPIHFTRTCRATLNHEIWGRNRGPKIRQGKAAELKKLKVTAPEEKRKEVRRVKLFMTNENTNEMSEFETLFKVREAIENYKVIIPFISFFCLLLI